MKTKRIITATCLVAGLMFGNVLRAQTAVGNDPSAKGRTTYSTAVGLRAGETSGLTIKHFFNSTNAVEGIIGLWPNAISLTGLYERHKNAGLAGLCWYYGGGGHFAFQTGRIYYVNEGMRYYRYYNDEIGIGIDGILGMEYKIPVVPFAFSIDVKPFFEVNSAGHAYMFLDPGIGIKVVF